MKKSARILAVVMAMLMVTLVFASCGNTLSGTYKADLSLAGSLTLEFKGKNVTATYDPPIGENTVMEATYEIEDDKITFETAEGDKGEWLGKLLGTQDFSKTDDGIKIGIFSFVKQ